MNLLPSEFKRSRGVGLQRALVPGPAMKVNQPVVILVRGQQPVRPSVEWTPGLQCLGWPEHCQGFRGLVVIELEIVL